MSPLAGERPVGFSVPWCIGSMCHCGEPEECSDHWQIEEVQFTSGGKVRIIGGPARTVIAKQEQSLALLQYVVRLHNDTLELTDAKKQRYLEPQDTEWDDA